MNWTEYIDKVCGDRKSFSNREARELVRKALEFCSDNWINHRR